MKPLLAVFAFAGLAAAQNLSPFAPPPFSTNPGTCYVGQIITNTTTSSMRFCIGANTWQPLVEGPVSTVSGYVPLWADTTGDSLQAGFPVTQTGLANAIVETTSAGTISPNLVLGLTIPLLNDASGTTVNTLAKINSAGKWQTATVSDTAIPVFPMFSGAGTSGLGFAFTSGQALCIFDSGGATLDHFVVASTITGGDCHDAGASVPASGWVVGQVSFGAAGGGLGGLAIVPGYYAASGGGGGISSLGFTSPTNGFTFTSSTSNPITSTGTFTLGFATESAGVFFGGPCSGSAAAPTWRTLCFTDFNGSVNSVSPASTTTFNLALGNVQTITLSATAVTTSLISNAVAGNEYTWVVCQDGTGGRSFPWPSGFHGTMTIGSTASLCSSQSFIAQSSSVFYAIGPGVINQ